MSQQQDNHQPTEYSDAHTSEHSDATEYSDKGMRNTPTKGSKRAPLSDDPRLDKIANVMLMMLYYGVSRSVDIPMNGAILKDSVRSTLKEEIDDETFHKCFLILQKKGLIRSDSAAVPN